MYKKRVYAEIKKLKSITLLILKKFRKNFKKTIYNLQSFV